MKIYFPDRRIINTDTKISHSYRKISFTDEKIINLDAKISNSDKRILSLYAKIIISFRKITNTDKKIENLDGRIELTDKKSLAKQGFFSFMVSSFIFYFGRVNSNPLTCGYFQSIYESCCCRFLRC